MFHLLLHIVGNTLQMTVSCHENNHLRNHAHYVSPLTSVLLSDSVVSHTVASPPFATCHEETLLWRKALVAHCLCPPNRGLHYNHHRLHHAHCGRYALSQLLPDSELQPSDVHDVFKSAILYIFRGNEAPKDGRLVYPYTVREDEKLLCYRKYGALHNSSAAYALSDTCMSRDDRPTDCKAAEIGAVSALIFLCIIQLKCTFA